MAVVVLSFLASEEEITEGIPEALTIESNIPSTIFFTLDGTTPDTNSAIYVDTIQMPEGEPSVIVSAFGIDSDGYAGPILTQVFAADHTRLDRTRNVRIEGIAVDRFADPLDIVVGYDADGDATAFSDIQNIDLREIHSSQGRLGIAEGTQIEIGTPLPDNTPYPFDDNIKLTSSPSDDIFDPYALTIIIDDRKDNVIKILNRPYGSMRNLAHETWGQRELGSTDSTYVSGGFVRRFYSPKNNLMVSYYFDHNSARWVTGLQELPPIPNTFNFNQAGQPLVFRWLDRGRHSAIPI